MTAPPPPPPVPPLIEMLRTLTGRPDVGLRWVTPEQARRMNIPNALVDAVPLNKQETKFRPARRMYMPQSTYQALDSLTRDTGVNWPEKTQALALMTFLHEAGHMRGLPNWQNERRQQRFALNKYMWAAKQLGLDEERRRRMYDEVVRYTRSLPRGYWPRNLR